MKNILTSLALLFMLGMAACNQATDHPATAELDNRNAALELYCKYADNESLTVAYLGDFSLNGNKIDALMIQANDDSAWEDIKLDFGMLPKYDSLECNNTRNDTSSKHETKKMAVGVGIETDFVNELGLDTITDLSQVSEERFNQLTENIASKIRDVINSFTMSDSLQASSAVIAGEGVVNMGTGTLSTDEYIQALAAAIGNSMLNELIAANTNGTQQDELRDTIVGSTMRSALSYGHSGYISAADDSNKTVWLFFYDNQEECNIILAHIKEDILIGEPITEEN